MSVVTRLACLSCFWTAVITDLRGELPSFPKHSVPLVFSKKRNFGQILKSLFSQKLISSHRHPDLFGGGYVCLKYRPVLIFHFFTSAPLAPKPLQDGSVEDANPGEKRNYHLLVFLKWFHCFLDSSSVSSSFPLMAPNKVKR